MKNPIVFILLLLSQKTIAQIGNIFYGGTGDDFIAEMIPSPDGNFYAIGSKTEGIQKVWLLKINPLGALLWEKTFTPSNTDFPEHGFSVDLLTDGSLIITGEQITDDVFNEQVALALKTDAAGNQIWKQLFNDVSSLYDAKPDGNNIIMGGWFDNTGSSDSGILLLTNSNGTTTKRIEIKTSNQNFVKKIIPTSDNNFIVAGRSNVIGVGYQGVFLQKVTPAGDAIWTVTKDTGFDEGSFGFNDTQVPHPLGIYIDAADTIWVTNPKEYSADISLLKFLPNGSLADEKIFGNPGIMEFPYALLSTSDNGFIISGGTADGQAFAMKINNSGVEQWRNYYNRDDAEMTAYDIDKNGTGYLLSGRFLDNLNLPADYDGWLLGIEQDGNQFPFSLKGRLILDENKNCQQDPGEIPLAGWFIDIKSFGQSDNNNSIVLTDESGRFDYAVGASSNQLTLYNSDTAKWNICSPTALIEINSNHPEDSVLFLVQPSGNCIAPEVSLTQPDFVRCDTSCLVVSVKNDSPEPSDPLLLTLEFDDVLHLTSCTMPYGLAGNTSTIQLETIDKFESTNLDVCFSLDCDVQLGATHTIKASISPLTCEPVYTGPRFNVNGYCDGSTVKFLLENIGGGGNSASTTYSVYADGISVTENEIIQLPEGADPKEISLPADGRTWLIEVIQSPEDPHQDHPSAAIEGCGKGNNGLHSIAFLNGTRPNDEGPESCVVRAANTIGVPNKIAESTQGYGLYNYLTDARRMEFSLRAKNSFAVPASEYAVDIKFSPSLDIRTFRLLSSPGDEMISLVDTSTIRILYQDLLIEPGQTVMLRFTIQPRQGTLPDDNANSLFFITANAYFDGQGPVVIEPGFYNFTNMVPVNIDPYNQYDKEIKLFGGRNYDFGARMAKGKDGSVFTCGESNSFGLRSADDGFVIKLNNQGEVIWQTALDAGNFVSNTLSGIAPLSDGGCLVSGNYWDPQVENYVENVRLYVARLDAAGKVLWIKHLATPPDVPGAWTYGMLETADQNFLIHGIAKNDGTDQFYLKINDNGDILWSRYPNITGSFFEPEEGVALSDGSFVFVGSNESTVIDADVYIEKISANGDILWDKEYHSQYGIYLGDIAQSGTGNFMITGYSEWAVNDTEIVITPTFIKVTSAGEILWEKNPITGPFEITEPSCIVALPNQDFIVGGSIFADTVDHYEDMLMMKVSEEGDVEWYKNFGARNYESTSDILFYSQDEIMLWGFNQDEAPFYNLQSIFLKTNGEGELSQVKENVIVKNEFGSYVFPNPVSDVVHIVLSPEPNTVVPWILADISGRILLSGKEFAGPSFDIDLQALQPGPYYISFPGTRFSCCRIIVVQ